MYNEQKYTSSKPEVPALWQFTRLVNARPDGVCIAYPWWFPTYASPTLHNNPRLQPADGLLDGFFARVNPFHPFCKRIRAGFATMTLHRAHNLAQHAFERPKNSPAARV